MVVLASIGLWTALLTHDFSLEYVAGHISANMPKRLHLHGVLERTGGIDALLGADPVDAIRRSRSATSRARNRELDAVGDRHARRRSSLFFIATTCFKANPFDAARLHAARRARDESAAPESGHGDPSAESLPRLRRHGDSVRVRHRRAVHAPARRGVAGRRAALGAALVVLPHDRHHARHVVGVRRARMGRLLGVGSGRERVASSRG